MTLRDEIVDLLRCHPAGLPDGEIAKRLDKLHPAVNQQCRYLVATGVLTRELGRDGLLINSLASPVQSGHAELAPRREAGPRVWPHESVVQSSVVAAASAAGWRITRVAHTDSHERGVDVVAERDGERLLVEVKGYPGTTYVRGPKAGEPTSTQPSVQAQHYYADALLATMRLRDREPDRARVVIALPDFPRYRTLASQTRGSLERCGIEVWWVHDSGVVERA